MKIVSMADWCWNNGRSTHARQQRHHFRRFKTSQCPTPILVGTYSLVTNNITERQKSAARSEIGMNQHRDWNEMDELNDLPAKFKFES